MTILDRHLHTNADPHRLTATSSTQLRCWDCRQTLDLAALTKVDSRSTSTSSQPLNIKDDSACELHPGQRNSHCGPCRSERLAPHTLIDQDEVPA